MKLELPSTLPYKEIVFSDLPYLPLMLQFPFEEMLSEARSMLERFVDHREYEGGVSGWKALVLHGIAAEMTQGYEKYGIPAERQSEYCIWTEIADACPVTRNYFQSDFPGDSFGRIRFMLLRPGGVIPWHADYPGRSLASITLALNHPPGCDFLFNTPRGHVKVPFQAGKGFALNLSYPHQVVNLGTEDRFHMIVHVLRSSHAYRELIVRSHQAEMGRTEPSFVRQWTGNE